MHMTPLDGIFIALCCLLCFLLGNWTAPRKTFYVFRTMREKEKLNPAEEKEFRSDQCPDCEQPDLLEGPSGGCSTNYKCGTCGSRFNDMGPFGVERISNASPDLN